MEEGGNVDLQYDRDVNRFRVISTALSIALNDDEEDYYIFSGWKRKRTHAYWMSPYLPARIDRSQRNTFAKLESDFLRVSIIFAIH